MTDTEIQFGKDSPQWPTAKGLVESMASNHLQARFDAAKNGVDLFRDQAREMVEQYIVKPPGHISVFGAVTESVLAVCEILVPEAGEVHELYKVVKAAYDGIKPAVEALKAQDEELTADTIDKAQKHLINLAATIAQGASDHAWTITQTAKESLGSVLDAFIDEHPEYQIDPNDSELPQRICSTLGLPPADLERIKDEVWAATMPRFRQYVEMVAAQIHFFHGMDNDTERLAFLIKIDKEGTNPDEFLKLIGADQAYWDRYLAIYREQGDLAAMEVLALTQ